LDVGSPTLKQEDTTKTETEVHKNPNSNIQPPTPNLDREQRKELQRLQKQFSKLEEEINQLNNTKTDLELELAKPENYYDKNKFLQLEKNYSTIQQKIAAANVQYEQLFEKIMQMES
jgi:ATP-binding cassette subfamily F protein 3